MLHNTIWLNTNKDLYRVYLVCIGSASGEAAVPNARFACCFISETPQGQLSVEYLLQINIPELRAFFLALYHWSSLLHGHPVRVQTDNTTAVAYLYHQEGTRCSALLEVSRTI